MIVSVKYTEKKSVFYWAKVIEVTSQGFKVRWIDDDSKNLNHPPHHLRTIPGSAESSFSAELQQMKANVQWNLRRTNNMWFYCIHTYWTREQISRTSGREIKKDYRQDSEIKRERGTERKNKIKIVCQDVQDKGTAGETATEKTSERASVCMSWCNWETTHIFRNIQHNDHQIQGEKQQKREMKRARVVPERESFSYACPCVWRNMCQSEKQEQKTQKGNKEEREINRENSRK